MIEDFKNILSREDFRYLIFLFFGMLISALIEMVGLSSIPVFILIVVDVNTLIEKFPNFFAIDYINNLSQNTITIYGGLLLVAVFFFKNLYLTFFYFCQGKIIKNMRTNITNKVFNRYINANYSFHISNNPSVLTRSITSSVAGSVNTILSTLNVTKEILVLIVIFVLLSLNEPLVSFSVFFCLIFITGVFLFLTRKELISRGGKIEEVRKDQLKTINHALGSIRETKILNREKYLTNIFKFQINEMEKHSFFMYFLSQTPRLFLEFIAIFAIAIIAIIFVLIDLTSEQILPIISLLAVCSIRLIPAFNLIISSLSTRRFATASLKIISNALKNTPIEKKFQKNNALKKNIKKNFFIDKIILDNVTFVHENSNTKILEQVSLEVKQGQSVGIIGKSGAGKSTLIDLILGLIKPVTGKIYIDSEELENNIQSWQKLIGYVPQDIYLLDDTIKNNIGFGLDSKDINQENLLKSIKLAKLNDFINSLPEKENTIVGNRGVKVSGGQKQRIGLARALYNNPKVLVLDEATSSLDFENERKIMEEVYTASKDCTLFIITHRHTSVFNCDIVYLIDKGRIIDKGKYEDLLNRHTF
jgi:ABC-type multidrug transport system fused ATPase/permease subunit